MSRTLIISDNGILSELYAINLEVYLATDVSIVTSVASAMSLIGSDIIYDLIISLNFIGGQDMYLTLTEFIGVNKLRSSLIIIGSPPQEIPKAIFFEKSYNIKNILCSCAEILGVTSKSMASLAVPEYYPVNIKFLIHLDVTPCEIYLEVRNNDTITYFTMIAKKGSSSKEFFRKFAAEGIKHLFVNKFERLLVINLVSTRLSNLLMNTENIGINDKSIALEEGFEFLAADFCHSAEAIEEVMSIASASLKVMSEISNEVAGLKDLLQIVQNNKNGHIFAHSILSSFIAGHIIKKVPWGSDDHNTKINFVLFFHDIFLAPIYNTHPNLIHEDELLSSTVLTEKEKNIVRNHARLAAEAVASYRKIPMGVDLLIRQHHGMINGIGFAAEFKNDVSPLSKIIIISEAFVQEYLKAIESDPKYKIILNTIIGNLKEKFNRSTYVKIIETLDSLRL